MTELIPASIDALLELATDLRTNGFLTGTDLVRAPEVLDGVDVMAVSGCYLALGVDGEDDIAATLSSGQAGLAGPRRLDSANITCLAYASGGNTDMAPYRDAAFGWYRAVRDAVEADTRLGGAVGFAQVTTAIYRPKRSGSGAGAGVEFRVQTTAL